MKNTFSSRISQTQVVVHDILDPSWYSCFGILLIVSWLYSFEIKNNILFTFDQISKASFDGLIYDEKCIIGFPQP